MMFDRDSESDSWGTRKPIAVILMWGLGICFLVQSLANFYAHLPIEPALALSNAGLKEGKLWTLFTYQFLHGGPWPWHLIGNCLGLYFIGLHFEELYGARRFLWTYFGGAGLGAVVQVLVTALPSHNDSLVLGASAGVMSLLAAYATAFPERQITTFIYFIPVTLKASWLLWFFGGLAAFGSLFPFDTLAHGAHLGGILFGIFYVKTGSLSEFGGKTVSDSIERWMAGFRRGTKSRNNNPVIPVQFPRKPQATGKAQSDTDFIAREVDPILEKIAKHGIESLTSAERMTLETARQRVAQR